MWHTEIDKVVVLQRLRMDKYEKLKHDFPSVRVEIYNWREKKSGNGKISENALRQGYMDGDVQQGTTIFYQVH